MCSTFFCDYLLKLGMIPEEKKTISEVICLTIGNLIEMKTLMEIFARLINSE